MVKKAVRPKAQLHPVLRKHFNSLIETCRRFGVEKLYVFGSAATGKFRQETSDLDFIVELEPLLPVEKGERLMSFWTELEDLFGKKVDLLTEKPVKNPYLKRSIDSTKQLIYDRASEEVSV